MFEETIDPEPDPDWIRIQWGPWNGSGSDPSSMVSLDPDPDQEGQK